MPLFLSRLMLWHLLRLPLLPLDRSTAAWGFQGRGGTGEGVRWSLRFAAAIFAAVLSTGGCPLWKGARRSCGCWPMRIRAGDLEQWAAGHVPFVGSARIAGMTSNELYMAVLPLIHLTPVGPLGFGLTEETLTLLPGRELATRFHRDDVERYIETFRNRMHYLTGPRVSGYHISTEESEDGLFLVKVVQVVA